MKLSMKVATALALASVTVSAPAWAEKPPELSATELAAVQSHNYNVPADVAFKAVVAALQTLGYVDINASKDAGTVTGQTEAKAKMIYNIFWGLGKKKRTQKASLLVEENPGAGSLVRLNLILSESKSRGIWGTSFTDGKLVRFADPYNEFFAALNAEIARRTQVAPTVAPATAAPVAIAPSPTAEPATSARTPPSAEAATPAETAPAPQPEPSTPPGA